MIEVFILVIFEATVNKIFELKNLPSIWLSTILTICHIEGDVERL